MLVATAHLKSGKKEAEQETKHHQARQIAHKLMKHSKGDVPIIFACDFNNACGDKAFNSFYPPRVTDDVEWWNEKTADKTDDELKKLKPKDHWARKTLSSAYALPKVEVVPAMETVIIANGNEDDRNQHQVTEREKLDKKGENIMVPVYVKDEPNNNETSYSAVKWRIGGAQPNKIENTPETQTIDFIFHSSKYFKTVGTLSIPDYDTVLKRSDELCNPCWRYPSDHFMIGADLLIAELSIP